MLKWIKSHLVISIIIVVVFVGGAIATPIIINNYQEQKEIERYDEEQRKLLDEQSKRRILEQQRETCRNANSSNSVRIGGELFVNGVNCSRLDTGTDAELKDNSNGYNR